MFGLLAGSMPAIGASTIGNEKKPEDKDEKFDASSFILDHVADSHEWHLWTKEDGSAVAVYLPVIVYEKASGLHIFSSRKIAHGHSYEGFAIAHEGKNAGKMVHVDAEGHADETKLPLDFSITKAISE
jgi:F-type H+-transporting ATPase subunit a